MRFTPPALVLLVWLGSGPLALTLSSYLLWRDRTRERRIAAVLDGLVADEADSMHEALTEMLKSE